MHACMPRTSPPNPPRCASPLCCSDAGLPNALALLTPIKEQFPELGWADLIQVRTRCSF